MLEFKKLNVNPLGRRTGDCSTRALTSLLNIPYDKVLDIQLNKVKDIYFDLTSREVMESILQDYGWAKQRMPRRANGKKYKVCELDEILDSETRRIGVLVNVANHYTIIKGNEFIDTWNCGYKTCLNYFVYIGE